MEIENGVLVDVVDSVIQEVVKLIMFCVESLVVRQLVVINENGGKLKNKILRFRRVFFFGSVVEFWKVVYVNSEVVENGLGKFQKEQSQEDVYEME